MFRRFVYEGALKIRVDYETSSNTMDTSEQIRSHLCQYFSLMSQNGIECEWKNLRLTGVHEILEVEANRVTTTPEGEGGQASATE